MNSTAFQWKIPKLQFLSAGKWQVIDGYSYVTEAGIVINIPAGFLTDGVSSPRFLWAFIPSTGEAFPAGIIHDFLYVAKPAGMDRRACDRILWEACRRLQIDKPICDAIYAAVRLGGGGHW